MGWTSINPRKNKEFISNMPWVLTHQIEGESSQDPWCTPSLASTKWDCRGLCCAWVLWFPFHGRPMPRGQQPALKPVPKVGPSRSWNPRLPKGPFCFLMFFTKTRDILVFFGVGTCCWKPSPPDRRTICATWACGTLILCWSSAECAVRD